MIIVLKQVGDISISQTNPSKTDDGTHTVHGTGVIVDRF